MKQLFTSALAITLAAAGLAQAGELTVEIVGATDGKGIVRVAVYDRAEDFLKKSMRTATIDAQPGNVQLVIPGLPPGDYALSAFQDWNGNGKLDKNLIGMPVEPYGFSNDAAGSWGPPDFAQSRAHLPEAGRLVRIHLR